MKAVGYSRFAKISYPAAFTFFHNHTKEYTFVWARIPCGTCESSPQSIDDKLRNDLLSSLHFSPHTMKGTGFTVMRNIEMRSRVNRVEGMEFVMQGI